MDAVAAKKKGGPDWKAEELRAWWSISRELGFQYCGGRDRFEEKSDFEEFFKNSVVWWVCGTKNEQC